MFPPDAETAFIHYEEALIRAILLLLTTTRLRPSDRLQWAATLAQLNDEEDAGRQLARYTLELEAAAPGCVPALVEAKQAFDAAQVHLTNREG